MSDVKLYGLTAEFTTAVALLKACRRTRDAGYLKTDAYAPFPVEGLAEALGHRRTRLPLLVLASGIVGGAGAYFMQWYAMAVDYPINVGGRPLHSWPSFIPITFELTILCAAIAAGVGMFALNGLPRLHHPIFNVPAFSRVSIDRFFLCIEADDPLFDHLATRDFLAKLEPLNVEEARMS